MEIDDAVAAAGLSQGTSKSTIGKKTSWTRTSGKKTSSTKTSLKRKRERSDESEVSEDEIPDFDDEDAADEASTKKAKKKRTIKNKAKVKQEFEDSDLLGSDADETRPKKKQRRRDTPMQAAPKDRRHYTGSQKNTIRRSC